MVERTLFEKRFHNEVLNFGGKTPETRDMLIMCVTAGRRSSKHSTNKEAGMGSSEQVFGADLSIMVEMHQRQHQCTDLHE